MALAVDAGLWAAANGLVTRLTCNGHDYVLRSHAAPLVARLMGNPTTPGTVLLRARRYGDALEGTAYFFAANGNCVFPYPVIGRFEPRRISWHGNAPIAADLTSCRVLRTTFTISTVTLISSPVERSAPSMNSVSSVRQTIGQWRDNTLAAIADYISAAIPDPPKLPDLEFSPSLPMLVALGMGSLIALALCAFVLSFITLRLMAVLADARVALAERRSQLASVAPSRRAGLSADEIERILDAAFPDIAEGQRVALARTIAAAIRDKDAS
jgi:hypothetical protein